MYRFFSPAQITPQGWLLDQLRLQANGLAGNLDRVWPDVRDSAWIGGDREGWERVPYWLDGFIPLAFLLRDDDLIARAETYISAILDRQCEDGWICPCPFDKRPTYDTWSFLLIGKVLALYCECTECLPDKKALHDRTEIALARAMHCLYTLLDAGTVRLFDWGKYRWFEGLVALQFLMDRCQNAASSASVEDTSKNTTDSAVKSQNMAEEDGVGMEKNTDLTADWIVSLAKLLREQGADWSSFTDTWVRPKNQWTFHTHIVNIGMMFKYEAVSCALLGEKYTNIAEELWRFLEKYHGTAVGSFTGDECLSGRANNQGTELCSINELLYSCELLYSITGNGVWMDRAEKLAFNALPATISDDMWTHQYDQQVNQIACRKFPGRSLFRTNGAEAHLFGLEPNFGCCTANMGQGWPKFALSVFQKWDENTATYGIANGENTTYRGIDCAAFVPARLDTSMGDSAVSVQIESEYPFRLGGRITVTTDTNATFTLTLRIPGWARYALVNGEMTNKKQFSITKEWSGTETIEVQFVDVPHLIDRPAVVDKCAEPFAPEMKSVEYGPLVFALPIEADWVAHEYEANGVERKQPYCDYELIPQSDWRFGFAKNEMNVEECPVTNVPFSSKNPPVKLHISLAPVDWDYADGFDTVAAPVPNSNRAMGTTVERALIPYGCAKLRITEMCVVR